MPETTNANAKNPTLFVYATTRFAGDGTLYWSSSNHAWGCLSSAEIYTLAERRSLVTRVDEDRQEITHRNTGKPAYVPTGGEFHELPDMLRLKTTEEWVRDIA